VNRCIERHIDRCVCHTIAQTVSRRLLITKGQSRWDFQRTKWHCERLFSEHFGFTNLVMVLVVLDSPLCLEVFIK
jgi:hypothetical protein